MNLAAAVIAASAMDGEVDQLVPILDEHLYEATGVAHAATTLALRCYCNASASAVGHHRNTVQARRIACGLTQEGLRRLAGISKGVLASIETLGSTPSTATKHNLALALKCTVAELWPDN